MRTVLLAAALAAALAAPLAVSAQETAATLFPFVPGNTWTYVMTSGSEGRDGGGGSYVTGTALWTALDSADVGGERLARLRIEYRTAQSGLETAECVVRTTDQPDGSLAAFSLFGLLGGVRCEVPADAVPAIDVQGIPATPGLGVGLGEADPQPVTIGGEALGDRLGRVGLDFDFTGNFTRSYYWRVLNGIGVLSFSRSSTGGGTTLSNALTLRQATVGGQTVGQPLSTHADFWPRAVGDRREFLLTD